MKFRHLFILSALCAFTQGVWAQWSGDGTVASPYQISTVDDLNRLATDVNNGEPYTGKYFALTQDISNVGTFTPIGFNGKSFNGVFDGGGFTISDIYINYSDDSQYVGLFGRIGYNSQDFKPIVRNVKLTSLYINASDHYVGGIVGENFSGTVEDCYVLWGSITGCTACGGIVGQNHYGTIKNCHVAKDVTVKLHARWQELGGIAGYSSGTVSGCTCYASIVNNGSHIIGGIVGWNTGYGTIENSLFLASTFKSSAVNSGAIAGNNLGTVTNSYYINKTFKGIGVDDYNLGKDVEGAQLADYTYNNIPEGIGNVVSTYGNDGITVYSNGLKYNNCYYTPYVADGTIDHPYIIASRYDLNQLASNVNNGSYDYEGKDIILVNDLDYSNSNGYASYTPIGSQDNPFKGRFNGKGHTISGIEVNTSNNQVGVFGFIREGAEVNNLTLASSNITGGNYTGGIVGENWGTVTNCHVAEDVNLQLYHENNSINQVLGGIVGWNCGTIAGCTNVADLNIVGYREIGGIAGFSNGDIMDCLYFGNITVSECKEQVGAIVGSKNSGATLTNNFYTDLTIRGIGKEDAILGEDVEGALYAQAYSESELPVEIGNVVRDYGNDGDITIRAYAKGLHDASTGKYYYPGNALLVLFDGEDNTAAIEPYIGRTVNVRLQGRYLYKDGTWNTLCLPFDVKIPGEGVTNGTAQFEGAEFMEITTAKFDNGTLNLKFNSLVGCSAGEPFLVRWPVAEGESVTTLNPIFENVKIGRITSGPNPHYLMTPIDAYAAPHYPVYEGNPDNLLVMKGSYGPVTLSAGDRTKLYLCAENTLYYPEADVTLGAFRCYFELLGGLTAGDHPNEVNAFNLNFGDNDASAIKDVQSMVNVQSSMFNVQWYTLDGRRLNGMPTQRGIYIVGGKKVVIK